MFTRYKSIVIAVDSSEESNQVLEAARELSGRDTSDYHVISVIPPMIMPVSGMDPSAFTTTWSLQDIEQELTQQVTESVIRRAIEHGMSGDCVQILHGSPAATIRTFADQVGADLIIIGSHARKGVVRLMLGSTANAVLHGAPCDVLTIRVK